ncbi:MAG TPA: rhomboid family intramembrane serine protease [Phycisphaerae bacterium]|nr:rhomboid family intramembrane serine protease [Phycisphaerae bacterium]
MSWRDRPYSGPEYERPELRLQFRRPGTVIGWIIILNVVIFFLDLLLQKLFVPHVHKFCGLSLWGVSHLMVWQPVTYMFLHGGVLHLLFNMLMIYVCGTEFERAFGSRRLIQFYAICGIVGGLAYAGLGAINPQYYDKPLIGASGAAYGLAVAAIIFFPHIQVILFIIPVPIRVFGLIMLAILLFEFLSPEGIDNPGGQLCHAAGAVTALLIIRSWGMAPRITIGGGEGSASSKPGGWLRNKTKAGAWEHRRKRQAEVEAEVDHILAKVRENGMQSLTRHEKKILAEATRRQQERDRDFDHRNRL